MSRAVAWLMVCAVYHLAPPIIYATLLVSDPQAANDLTPWAMLWAMLTLTYDRLRMRGYRG